MQRGKGVGPAFFSNASPKTIMSSCDVVRIYVMAREVKKKTCWRVLITTVWYIIFFSRKEWIIASKGI